MSGAAPPPAVARPTALMLIILGSLVAMAPLAIDLYLPALPELGRDLGASTSTVQLTLTTCLIGLAVGQLLAGPVADALGRRRPLLVGLTAFVVASALCAVAPSVEVLSVLRLIQGAAGAAGIVIGFAIVRDLYGPSAARTFALLLLVTGLTPVVAPLVGAQALHVTTWRGTFVILVALGLALLAASALRLPETLPPERRRTGGWRDSRRTLRRLCRDRSFMPYAAALALGFGAIFSYIAASPFVLEDIHGLSPQMYSVVFAVNSAALVTAAQVGGHFVERVGPGALLRIGLAGMAVSGVVVPIIVLAGLGLAPLLAGLFLLMAANGLVLPNSMALALAHQGDAAGTASALIGFCQFGGAALLAPLVGVAGADSALPMAIGVAGCALGAIAVVRLARAAPPPPPSAP